MAKDNMNNNSAKAAANAADEALDSFLSREAAPKKEKKPGKKHRGVILLLAAVAVVAVLTVVIILLNSSPYPQSTDDVAPEAWTIATVDEAGVHEVQVPTDAKGKPQKNGTGTLLAYVPAQVDTIRVENYNGSFTIRAHTPAGEATEYLLDGLEDFPLQTGMPDAVANDAVSLQFLTIAGAGKSLSDYGLDAPRAIVTVAYTDGTSARILVGSDAVAEAGTYIAFGTQDNVYLVESAAVDSFFYAPADFISLTVTDSPDTVENAALIRLTLTGSHYPEAIVLEPNADEAVIYQYCLTAPRSMYADAVMSADIAGSVRSLYAEKVVAVNTGSLDKEAFLAPYGLSSSGYAEVVAEYPDAVIRLRASAPESDGSVYLINDSDPLLAGRVIYQIQIGAVSWASASLDKLVPDTVLSVSRTTLKNITLTAGGKSASIDVDSRTQSVDTTDGGTEQVTTTEAYYNGKQLNDDIFSILLQNLAQTPNKGFIDGSSDTRMLTVVYTYSTGRAPDTVALYDAGAAGVIATLNGAVVGSTPKSYVEALVENLNDLIAGKVPKSL